MEAAVTEQKELLAEFDKVADELNNILANLEGSTLVKRLKAASRKQQAVASTLSNIIPNSFGVSEREKEVHAQTFAQLAEVESNSSSEASHIMDDMAAYFERSRFMLFQRVLDDMREQDVTAELRLLADDLRREMVSPSLKLNTGVTTLIVGQKTWSKSPKEAPVPVESQREAFPLPLCLKSFNCSKAK